MGTYFVATTGSDANDGRDHLGFALSGAIITEGEGAELHADFSAYTWTAGDRIYVSSAESGFVPQLCEVLEKVNDGQINISPFPGTPQSYTAVSSSNGPKRTIQGAQAVMATGDVCEIRTGTYSQANGGLTADPIHFHTSENGKTLTFKGFTRPSGVTTPEAVTLLSANGFRTVYLNTGMASGALNLTDLSLASSGTSPGLLVIAPAVTTPIVGRLLVTLTRVTFTCANSQQVCSCESSGGQALRAGLVLSFNACTFNTVGATTHPILLQYVRRVELLDCVWTGGGRSMAAFQGRINEIVIRRATTSNWTGVIPDPPVLSSIRGTGFDFAGLARPGCDVVEIADCELILSTLFAFALGFIRRMYILRNNVLFKDPPSYANPSDGSSPYMTLGIDSSTGGYNEGSLGVWEDEVTLHHTAAATAGDATTVTLASMTAVLTSREYLYYAVLVDEATGLALATRKIVSVSGNVLTAESAWGVSPTWTDVSVSVLRVERGRDGIIVISGNTFDSNAYHDSHGVMIGLKTRNCHLWGNVIRHGDTNIVWKGQGGSCCFNRTFGGVGLGPKGGRGTYFAHNSHYSTDAGESVSVGLTWSKQFNTAHLTHGCEHNAFVDNVLDQTGTTGGVDVAVLEQDSTGSANGGGPCGYDNLCDFNALVKSASSGAASIFNNQFSTIESIRAAWATYEFVHTGAVASATSTTLTMDGAAPSTTRLLVDSDVEILAGTGSYQRVRITGHSGLVLTVAGWDPDAGTPGAGATFRIVGRRRPDNDASSVVLSGTAFRDPANGDFTIVGANGIPVFAAASDGLAIGYAQPKTGAIRSRAAAGT